MEKNVETKSANKYGIFDKIFHLTERGARPGIEILGGFITFVAMIYILPLISAIFGGEPGMSPDGVFAATAIVSALITIFMGLYANVPVILSAGLGVSAYVSTTVYTAYHDWVSAFIIMFLSGVIFLLITITPVRQKIIDAIPNDVKYIISAGLGGFIAFIGFNKAGLIVASNSSTIVALGDLANPAVLLPLLGVLIVFAFMAMPNKHLNQLAIPAAMGIIAVIGLIVNYAAFGNNLTASGLPYFDFSASSWGLAGIKDVFFKIFTGTETTSAGDAWKNVLSNPASYAFIFSVVFVSLFDTTATLMSVGRSAGVLDEKGDLIGGNRAILADAIGAAICAPIGTSTITAFAESNVACSTGAKTGLSAVTAGLLFLVSAFIFPVFSVFNSFSVTSIALISVGAMMFTNNLKAINWDDIAIGVTAFVSFMLMVLTYSISDGLGFGIITFVIMRIAQRKAKDVKPMLYVVALLFLVYYIVKVIIG
ncbi:MAG TPA: NCS2 family permease [Bacilli bacterium]|nr:NCS2 family permease [Bacilli bacterium]